MILFVYFDLGGVVIKDFTGTGKWQELEAELGITPSQTSEFIKFWDKYEPEVCVGRNLESLIPLMKNLFKTKIPKGYSFLRDGFVNRFEPNKSIWPVISQIKNECRLGLLTNMYPSMLKEIEKKGILPHVEWDLVIDSTIVGFKKPDLRIFKLAEEKASVSGSQILFVENSQKNINAAKRLGWQTFLYDSGDPERSSKNLLKFFKENHEV